MGLELSKNSLFRIRESHSLRLEKTQINLDSNQKMYQVYLAQLCADFYNHEKRVCPHRA